MIQDLNNVIGDRGESIVELSLTEYDEFQEPLFDPCFLGDKWPTIDFLVELRGLPKQRFYFFLSVKASTRDTGRESIAVQTKKKDIDLLLGRPGPTYVAAIHEPTKKTYIRSVHAGLASKTISSIPLKFELNRTNLLKLYEEVKMYWESKSFKPTTSAFS